MEIMIYIFSRIIRFDEHELQLVKNHNIDLFLPKQRIIHFNFELLEDMMTRSFITVICSTLATHSNDKPNIAMPHAKYMRNHLI